MRIAAPLRDTETTPEGGRPDQDPLATVVDYPWGAPVALESIPFGVDSDHRPISLGLRSNLLLAGAPGSGKSGGLWTLLCGISQLENVALVGVDYWKVDLGPWRSRFSRLAREEDTPTVLEAIIDEMKRRYAWLEEHDLKRLAPSHMSPSMPLIVLVIEELPALWGVGIGHGDRPVDLANLAMVRRIAAKGRAVGVVMIGTAGVAREHALPGELLDRIGGRVSYATSSPAMTDAILGAGISRLGGLSHEIHPELRGVCYVGGESFRVPVRARTYYVADWIGEHEQSPLQAAVEKVAHLRVDLPWMPVAPARALPNIWR